MGVRRGSYVSKKTGKPIWICDYRDQNGKRHELAFATKKEAQAALDRITPEIRSRTHTADSDSVPLDKAYDIFIAMLESEGAARATIDEYKVYYRNHVKPFLGSTRLTRIAAPDVQRLLDDLRDRGRSADTRKRAKKTLGAILDEMVRKGYIAFNAARTMRARRRARRAVIAEREKVIIPEKTDVQAIFAAETTVRGRAQLSAMCFAGLRIGEMRGLMWSRIDLEQGYLHVEEAADRFNHWGEVKTLAAKRTVPIGPALVRALKEWRLACPKGELGLAFPTSTGTVQSYANAANRWFAPLLIKAGLYRVIPVVDEETKRQLVDRETGEPMTRKQPIYTPHSLRHFAVSLWIDQGASPKQVSEWAGHEDVAFTMRVYGHLFKDKARERDRIAAAEAAVLG